MAVNEDGHARESLDRAAVLAHRMRAQGRWHVTFLALLGLVMFALILVSGVALRPPAQGAGFALALMALIGLVVYSASRKVVPRHHKLLYSVVTPLGAVLLTLTVLCGQAFFPGAIWWWAGGAALSTLPFWVFIAVNLAAGRHGERR